jgi:restriction endonuclease
MPAEYNKIITAMSNIFKGQMYDTYASHTVALLKDVTASSTTTIGTLPIYLNKVSDTGYTVDSRCDGAIKSVKVKITIPQGSTVTSVSHGGQTVAGYTVNGTELSYIKDITPGLAAISIQYQ